MAANSVTFSSVLDLAAFPADREERTEYRACRTSRRRQYCLPNLREEGASVFVSGRLKNFQDFTKRHVHCCPEVSVPASRVHPVQFIFRSKNPLSEVQKKVSELWVGE